MGQIYGDKNPEPKRRSTRERSRKRHRDRIAAGLCTRCGRQQVSNGSTVCEPCREARRVSDGERRDKGRKNEASRRRYAHRRAMNACKGRGLRRGQDADPALAQGRRGQRPLLDRDPAGPRVLDRSGAANGAAAAEAEAPANGSAMPDASAPAQADEMDRIPF